MRRLLEGLGYRIQGTRYVPKQLLDPRLARPLELADVIARRMLERGTSLTFVQIGAFDGVTKDPLHAYIRTHGWKGVLVEPQPEPAERLRALYAGQPGITVLAAAVDKARRERPLYVVDGSGLPPWAGGLASFDRTHILRHAALVPGLDARIKEVPVQCVPFEDVLQLLPSGDLDLLQIDAEGDDAYLLSLFPFATVKPAIVHWEIKNLTMDAREACLERLAQYGYRFAPSGDEDMLAVTA